MMKLDRNLLKKMLRPLQPYIELPYMLGYDAYRYVRYSGTFRKKRNTASIGALITKEYHVIEKGLSLPQPRPGFGEERVKALCALTVKSLEGGGCVDEVTLSADALAGYRDFNSQHGLAPQPWLSATLDATDQAGLLQTGIPVKEIHQGEAKSNAGLDILMTRASVRDFSPAQVPDSVLENAVRAAQRAPSVCNRQAGRIYLLRDPALKKSALSFQNGNRGFGDQAQVVAIITIDQAEMLDSMERYQHWIDGGMFAENFLLGIHAQGYGACPLNWSAKVRFDRGIRRVLNFIPASEAIIMMIAIGALKETYKVARSERRPISKVMKVL